MLTQITSEDIPNLSGKVIFITGGTAGLGKESILALAKHSPAHIFFSGRNATSAAAIISAAQTTSPTTTFTFLPLDLSSLASISAAARTFLAASARLDILILNAGIMAVPAGLTADGYEVQFGTNHLGHALLAKLLLPTLLRTAEDPATDVRAVVLTSLGFGFHPPPGILFETLKTPQADLVLGPWRRYSQSKLANILFAAELARRYPSITAVSVHPGVINTGLVSGLGWANRLLVYVMYLGQMVTPQEGVRNQLWGAVGRKEEVKSGGFYVPVGVEGPHGELSKSENLSRELWEWTEEELKGYSVDA